MAYGTALVDTIQSSTTGTPTQFNDGSGTQIGTLCRAWVNFNGITTATIRASFNVSSVTRNATGDYTVNFTNAMPDANYGAGCGPLAYDTGGATPTNYTALSLKQGAFATFNKATSCRFYTCYTASGSGGPNDFETVMVSFFR